MAAANRSRKAILAKSLQLCQQFLGLVDCGSPNGLVELSRTRIDLQSKC